MFGFFTWIRNQTRNAIFGGIGDALKEMDTPQPEGETDVLAVLRGRMAIPAKEGESTTNGKKNKGTN